jgi:hypothetical protein
MHYLSEMILSLTRTLQDFIQSRQVVVAWPPVGSYLILLNYILDYLQLDKNYPIIHFIRT